MEKEQLEQRKKMLTELMNDKAYVPMKAKELAMLLDIPKSRREELQEVLDKLVEDGVIGVSKKGKYARSETFSVNGLFSGHSRGFGFVTVEGMERDVFIPEDKTGAALHGDRVQIVITSDGQKGRRPEGAVIRVLEHANREVVGYFQKSKNFGFVVPDNVKLSRDIFIPQGCSQGAVTGHKVVVQLTDFGGPGRKPEGRITEILGHVNDPGTDILSLVRAYGLAESFPEDVMEELKTIPDELETEAAPEGKRFREDMPYYLDDLVSNDGWKEHCRGRLDLRGLQTVTIDGEDAKDLDDAVTLGRTPEGNYILGVHIADVSHYVKENSALDREALRRGTSVYLVDRVIPMLPHKLSNGICSLNEGTNRLALSCIMEIDGQGNVTDHRICETVICVDRRMSYTAVNGILTGEMEGLQEEHAELVPLFKRMEELSGIVRERRRKRGAIDFDFPESKIFLDEKGRPLEIRPYERNTATKIIEDFMLLANETVAEDFTGSPYPFFIGRMIRRIRKK